MDFTYQPTGSFELLFQNKYFNGWPTLAKDNSTTAMAFPVEGWKSSALVTLRQLPDGTLQGQVVGAADPERAKQQALAALSLDQDGEGWVRVGEGDAFVGELQQTYHHMRPSLFHSPYEAAAAFAIGHRITIAQGRALRARMAAELGDTLSLGGEAFPAFPLPQKLLEMQSFKGLNATKIERLHAIAQAALDGWLDRDHLKGLSEEAALAKLQILPGIGPFFAQGILYRGVGSVDGFTHDDLTYHAIQQAYHLPEPATKATVVQVAERWHPYRMWAIVLMHVWLRESGKLPKRTFSKR